MSHSNQLRREGYSLLTCPALGGVAYFLRSLLEKVVSTKWYILAACTVNPLGDGLGWNLHSDLTSAENFSFLMV